MSKWIYIGLLAVCAGCLGYRDNVVTVSDVDGSADHRIFRIGAATQIMLEPMLWRLEDLKLVDFDRPVTESFKGFLPPEFESVTLRMLHDGTAGLPRDFIDPMRISDLWAATAYVFAGSSLYRGFDRREDFVERLWEPRVRHAVARRDEGRSDMGYALLLMAICDRLGLSADELCQKYLVEPFGLKDTAFVATQGMRNRVTKACAGSVPYFLLRGMEVDDHRGEGEVSLYAEGMLSSAYDLLRICYVIMPHLDRAKHVLDERRISSGRTVWCRYGTVCGGNFFVGFDPEDSHAAVLLGNTTGNRSGVGLDLMENLVHPPETDDGR